MSWRYGEIFWRFNLKVVCRNLRRIILIASLVAMGERGWAQSDDEWAIFRGDNALRGVAKSEVADRPVLTWSVDVEDNFKAAPIVAGERVVIGSTGGTLYCFDLKGKLNWKLATGNSIEAPALVVGATVYVGNLDGMLLAVDLNSGKQIWSYSCENQIVGSANYWQQGDRTYVLVGSYDYFLHCVDGRTGKLLWKYESQNFINGAPACSNGIAYFGGCDGFLHAVDIATGRLIQKIEVGSYVASSVAVDKNVAWLGDYDGRFFALDVTTKGVVWQWSDSQTKLQFIASPAVVENKVLAANYNKFLYCFDRSSGAVLWRYNTGGQVEASPVATGNKVVVVSRRGDLSIVSLDEGKQIWSYELGDRVFKSPAISGRRIYIATYNGTLYCFGD